MPAANDNAKIISTIATMKRQRKVVFMSIISLMSTIGPASKKDKIEPVVKLRAYASAKKASILEQIETIKLRPIIAATDKIMSLPTAFIIKRGNKLKKLLMI